MRPFLSRALGPALLVFMVALVLAVPVALAGVTAPLKADKAVRHRGDESPKPKDAKPPTHDGAGDDHGSSSPPPGTTTTPTPPAPTTPPHTSPGPGPVPEPPVSPAPP